MTDGSESTPTRTERLAERARYGVEVLTGRIATVLAQRPAATRFLVAAFMLLAVVYASGRSVHAAPSFMQNEIDTAYNIGNNFDILDHSIALAQYIFATLAGITIIVQIVSHYIRNQTVQGLGKTILSTVLSLGIPFVIIELAPTVLPAISLVGLQITDIVTGNATSNVGNTGGFAPAPDDVRQNLNNIYNNTLGLGGFVDVTPKSIVDEGVKLAWPLLQYTQKVAKNPGAQTGTNGPTLNQAVFDQEQMMLGFVLALAIATIGAFVFIAVELVLAYLQIYLVLPVAAFSLGFLGSPATRQFGSGYWILVVQALVRFATIVFVIGFAMALAYNWDNQIAQLTASFNNPNGQNGATGLNDVGTLKAAITIATVSASLLYIVKALPGMFAAILTGMYATGEGVQVEGPLGGLQGGFRGRGFGNLAGQGTSGKITAPYSQATSTRVK